MLKIMLRVNTTQGFSQILKKVSCLEIKGQLFLQQEEDMMCRSKQKKYF